MGRRWTRSRATALPATRRALWTDDWRTGSLPVRQRLRAELRDAVFDAPDFDIDEVFTTVYAEITPGSGGPAAAVAGRTRQGGVMTQLAEPPARPDSSPRQTTPALTMVQALNRALHDAMAADDRVLVFGEDVARRGGVFRVTEGLDAAFGEQRCFDTPLAESAIDRHRGGLALRGFVPVPEIQFDGFSYPAFDQVVSHLAKYRTRTRGEINMPVTVRIPSFGGIGAAEHHSESTESYWAHTAGLKVVVPSTPADAYWLLRHASRARTR